MSARKLNLVMLVAYLSASIVTGLLNLPLTLQVAFLMAGLTGYLMSSYLLRKMGL